jgi:hypothetical protein
MDGRLLKYVELSKKTLFYIITHELAGNEKKNIKTLNNIYVLTQTVT